MKKPVKQIHTPKTQIAKGDSYGSGIKNPMGKIIDSSMGYSTFSNKKLKNPPKSLA